MNYRLYEVLLILFSIYFFYASYKGLPSILSNYLPFFGVKKRKVNWDKFYNGFTAVFLIILTIALEIKAQSLN